MTSLPPPSMPRPSGISGMQPSGPPSRGGGFVSGVGAGLSSNDYGFDQNTQVTNAPVNTKLAVHFAGKSAEETYRAIGCGQLIYARSMKTTAKTGGSMNAPGAAVSVVDPTGVSALNEWLRQPQQRRRYGGKRTYPSEFKFQGVQATHTDRGRSGFQGSWGEAVLTITASGVFHELPNIGMAHRLTKKGDKVYGVWQRVAYVETDFTKSYEDLMAERKLPKWDHIAGQLGPVRASADAVETALLNSIQRRINDKQDELNDPTLNVGEEKTIRNEIRELEKEHLSVLGAGRRTRDIYAGIEEKTLDDPKALPSSHYWRVVPYVSENGEAPPKALYITDECIGHVDPWYQVLTMRPMASTSQQSIQTRCKKALMPSGGGDDFIKALVSIPHCEAVICRA